MTEAAEDAEPTDLLLIGGTVIDGTSGDRRAADIAVAGGRISAVGAPGTLSATAARTLEVTGRIVAPGFIDVHTHDDNAVLTGPDMVPKISQGVTTVVAGNCGISLAPIAPVEPLPPMNLLGDRAAFKFPAMADYAAAVDAVAPSVNVAALVGHGTLRVGAMDSVDRKATTAEIDVMRERLAASLDAGAVGFSTGLWYKINNPADIDEVVALAEVLADSGGVYTTHMRDEHDGVIDSLYESFETANRANVPIVISHHKCAGPKNWGRSRETLPVIDKARRHQTIGLDAYPYTAGSTVLEPEMVDEDIRITVSWSRPHPAMAGRDLADIAREWGCSQIDAAIRLSPAGGIFFQIDESDMRAILTYPPTMIGSDGLPHDVHPHPRLWGTFPRVLGHFARDQGLFSLEQAVHKMTGLSAVTFGLTDRGEIRPGAYADLVVFDADTVIDRATFDAPDQPAAGIDHVIVGGTITWSDGALTGNRNGQFIRRT